VIFATGFLAQQPATSETIGGVREASKSPRESVAVAAFGALQRLGATGWEGSASGLMQGIKDDLRRIQLAGILAGAGRSEGWFIVRDALTPDNSSMGVAMWSAAPFHGLKLADGTTIDAIAELRRLRQELRQLLGELRKSGRSADVSRIEFGIVNVDMNIGQADQLSRRRGRAR
jgi:hypothetical protein